MIILDQQIDRAVEAYTQARLAWEHLQQCQRLLPCNPTDEMLQCLVSAHLHALKALADFLREHADDLRFQRAKERVAERTKDEETR